MNAQQFHDRLTALEEEVFGTKEEREEKERVAAEQAKTATPQSQTATSAEPKTAA